MSVTILQGDCLETLPTVAPESVHCVVTSPPYWGLRDYGLSGSEWSATQFVPMAGLPAVQVPAWSGCLGLEPDPLMFVAHIVQVFREVRRVLRSDGTCWVNFGDSYAAGKPKDFTLDDLGDLAWNNNQSRNPVGGLKHKDLCGIPWRVALALQADGWYLRSDIIWHKPNPMPESCTDRPTKSHEYFFLLTKSERYFYDAEAIREAAGGWNGSDFHDGKNAEVHPNVGKNRLSVKRGDFSGKTNAMPGREAFRAVTSQRNKRSVWTVATAPYSEAHFATFPPELIRPGILAGTSERGACAHCGAPWARVVEKGEADVEHQRACGGDEAGEYHGEAVKDYEGTGAQNASAVKARILEGMRKRVTTNWVPTCKCYLDRTLNVLSPVPCTVLDPFGGSGTTAAVAIEHGRRAVLCEMKPEYVKLINARLDKTQPGLF